MMDSGGFDIRNLLQPHSLVLLLLYIVAFALLFTIGVSFKGHVVV